MKVVILAGGLGTRLSEETAVRPKPMVEVGGRPLLWHIMKIYAHHGYSDFIVALGYKGEAIKRYFLDYHLMESDFSVSLEDGGVEVAECASEPWKVRLVDTGADTQTGGRLKRLKDWIGDDTFLMTYGDGVADIDIGDLVNRHRSTGRVATLTAVRPAARFGGVEIEDGRVSKFNEKARMEHGWINGGFFVLEPGVLDLIDGDATPFERAPLDRLTAAGDLGAYKHDSFWQCMDTLRDVRLLEGLWASGAAPWKVWD